MKTLVCLILLAAIAVILLPSPKPAEPARTLAVEPTPIAVPQAPSLPPVAAAMTPFPRKRPVEGDQLMILHGQIIKSLPAGVLVICTVPAGGEVGDPGNGTVTPAVQSATEADRKVYGPLMVRDHGQWRPADWAPESRADGTVVLVTPLPPNVIMPDGSINLIVAPINEHTVTADYEVTAARAGAWMWKNRGNPLEAAPK